MNQVKNESATEHKVEEYLINSKPFYLEQGDEISLFKAAHDQKIPVLLKGPTGCGKTRFVEYMTYILGQSKDSSKKNSKKNSKTKRINNNDPCDRIRRTG